MWFNNFIRFVWLAFKAIQAKPTKALNICHSGNILETAICEKLLVDTTFKIGALLHSWGNLWHLWKQSDGNAPLNLWVWPMRSIAVPADLCLICTMLSCCSICIIIETPVPLSSKSAVLDYHNVARARSNSHTKHIWFTSNFSAIPSQRVGLKSLWQAVRIICNIP